MTQAATTAPVVETVSRRRVVPPAELAKEAAVNETPEFWSYIESLTPEQWNDHVVYLYREDPRVSNYSGEFAYLDKLAGYIELRPGVQVPMGERGVIEAAIKEKFGGRAFRLICKKGNQRVCIGKCVNEALPKYPDTNPFSSSSVPPNPPQPSDSVAAVATKAIDTMSAKDSEAIKIGIDALRAASDIMRQQNLPGAHPTAQNNSIDAELDRAFKQALLQKLLAPQPDPFETFLKFKQVMGAGESNPLVNKLLEAAVERFMNAPAGGSTRSGGSGLVDLGREVIPVVAREAKEAVREWRLGMEAQERGIAISRGVNPGPPARTAPPATIPAPEPARDAGQTTSQPGTANHPPFQWIELKIVEILQEPGFTIDEAVDETLSFLYRAHPETVALLLDPPKLNPQLSPGEQGLLQLFQYEPILQQVPVNPRLVEFIKKFIAAAKEAESDRVGGTAKEDTKPSA